jgi:hypothetical protein
MREFLRRLGKRIRPMGDMTTWVLLTLSLVPLYLIDRALVVTLVQWSAYGLALTGLAVMLSRIVFPQIDLTEWVETARGGNIVAGFVILSVALVVSMLVLSLVLWART